MARFTAVVQVPAEVEAVWRQLVDWPAHGRWVPLTRVRVLTPRPDGVGARFVGRTGLGPVAFDDPMEVVAWAPPVDGTAGRCEVIKRGRVLRGAAWFEVVPVPGGCTVRWTEDVQLAALRLPRMLDGAMALAGRLAFTRTLRAMARELA